MFRPQKTALALAVCILTACQSTQIPLKSEITLPEAYGQNRAAQGSAETARWWQNWHDPVLGRLIEQGLAQGYDYPHCPQPSERSPCAGKAGRCRHGHQQRHQCRSPRHAQRNKQPIG